MAGHTQRMVLKEILVEDSDQLLKRGTLKNEQEETGKSRTYGLRSKPKLELSSTDCGMPTNLSGNGSYPRDRGTGHSKSPSASKGNKDDNKVSSGFPGAAAGKLKNPLCLRRLEDATIILRRVRDPRPNLSNVEGVSKDQVTSECCEAPDVADKHLKEMLEPRNVNPEKEFQLAKAANGRECSMDITRSSSLELSFSIRQEPVAIVSLGNLGDGGITQAYEGSSNVSSDLLCLNEGEMTLGNKHLTEQPTVISNLQDAITTSDAVLSSDKSATWNNLETSMLTASSSESSASLDAELCSAQGGDPCDLPTPVSMTTSPDDTAWWRHLTLRQEFETADPKREVDSEVLLNYSRMNEFQACSGLIGLELGSDRNGPKEIETPKSSKKRLNRLLRNSKTQSPDTPCDKVFTKQRNCTRNSPRLKRTSGITKELESKDAVECSKEGTRACKEAERSKSRVVVPDCKQESKAEIEDRDAVGDQLNLDDITLMKSVCEPMSLRSRRSSGIQDVGVTNNGLTFEETDTEIQLGDLSFKQEELKVRKTDKKLRTNRPPLLRCDWLVGDLLWAKMTGHPWWPCMLSYDPNLGLYTRSSTVGRVARARFHVRFFGEKPYRAWIADGSILQYEGVEAFERLCAQMLKTDLVHRPHGYYQIKDSRRVAWDAAVEEAERNSGLSRKDRLLRYNLASSTDSPKKSSALETWKSLKERGKSMSETGRSRKERGKSMSSEKVELGSPERKIRRRSEPVVQTKSNSKDPLDPDNSRKPKIKKEDRDGSCRKESKLEVLKLCGGGGGSGGTRKGTVCLSCEKEVSEEELISCEGSCLGSFHRACLGLVAGLPAPFVCDECTTGSHTCFVCKVTSVDTLRCSVSLCGKFYHLECVKKLRLAHADKHRLQCPLHACTTCTADDIKNPLASKGSLLRCLRCPTAYHSSDVCLAAGSERLPGNAIVCSRHLTKSTSQQHVNVNWCFLCSKGGTLLCCESCPASFHMDCLKIVTPPVGSWECEECTDGKRPLYGEIVWAKLGNYRWWPGEICRPRNIPESLMGARHETGEFPVRFFGTHNYFWANIGRVFLFQEDDKGSRESIKNGLDKSFSRAVEEANAAIRVWTAEKEKRDERSKAKADRKPPPYKHLKTNIVVGNVSVHRFNLDDIHPCSCRSDMVDPCGPESKCLNRDLSYECHPDVCPVGDRCQNRRFQQREYLSVVPFKTENRGWGLKTLVDVKEGQFVIEYVGELIDLDECRIRMKEMQTRKNSSFYLLTLDKDRIIDAGPRGNVSRFMNHSCQPNCETQKWTVNGDSRIGLFTIVDIPAGSELTFNYNLDCLGNEKLACHCGSAICSGYLGLRPKQSISVLSESSKKKRKRRVKKSFGSVHEDECFRCGRAGQLIMCDKSQCPKVYHLKCLRLNKAPHGKWICPWHHCDECGQPSTKLCNECENSFCANHVEGNIAEVLPGYLICSEHDELKHADDPSCRRPVEIGLCNEKLGLCGMEVYDKGLEKIKRKWKRSSMGTCEKNANGKRKRESSTIETTETEGGSKLLGLKNLSSAARNSCRRKRNGSTSSLTVSEKNSTRKYLATGRRKSLPENQFQSQHVVKCFGRRSNVFSKRNSKRRQIISVINLKGVARKKREMEESLEESFASDRNKNEDVVELSAVNIGEGNEKMKRKSRKASLLIIPAKKIKPECSLESGRVAVPSDSKETEMKGTKESSKRSLKINDAKKGIKATKEGKKRQKVLNRTACGVRASKKGSRSSRKSLSSLKSSVGFQKASVVHRKRFTRLKCSNFPLKISKTSKRNWTAETRKSTSSKDLQKALETSVAEMHHETEFHNNALKSFGRKLKHGKEQKLRKSERFKISRTSVGNLTMGTQKSTYARNLQKALEMSISEMQHVNNALKSFGRKLKQDEKQKRRRSERLTKETDSSDDGKMETEAETQMKPTDVAEVEIQTTEMPSLRTDGNSELLLDVAPVAGKVEVTCGSEVTHLEVTDEKCKIEEDSMSLLVQEETATHPTKLTRSKVLKEKEQRFGSGKRVMHKQSFEDKTRLQSETKNLEVKQDRIGSRTKIPDLETMSHSGLQIESMEIEVEPHKDTMNLKEKGAGIGSEKETEILENVGSQDLQNLVAVVEILDDSTGRSEGISSEITENIQNLSDLLVISRRNSKCKAHFYDTPSDSSESDVIFLQDGDHPDTKDCRVWDRGIEQNDCENGSASNGDKRKIIFEAASIGMENNCCGSSVRPDKKQEECPVDGKFPVMSKDEGMNDTVTSVGMNDIEELAEVLPPAGGAGKVTSVEHGAKLTNKDGVAVSVVDVLSEMKMSSRVEDDNASWSIDEFVREPDWKRNHKTSSRNPTLKSRDGKDRGLFPRTY